MRSFVFISQFILLFVGLALAQQNTFNKESELQKFVEQGGKVEEISPNIYRLTDLTGESITLNFNKKESVKDCFCEVDTTIINIAEIDTNKFNGIFTFWQQVQVANTFRRQVYIDDSNNNGLPELYGYSDYLAPSPPGPVRIFERDLDGIYKNVYTYDSSTIHVKGFGDIHRTGGKEIFLRSRLANRGAAVYKSDSTGTLPTVFDFIFYFQTNQINTMIFGDWDNNGTTDCAFIVGAGNQHCIISEYRDSINNFETVFQFSTTGEADLSGFAIGDFDQDNNPDFVVSTGVGNVYVIEYENKYSLVTQFPFPTFNAYMQTATKDIDGNGKTEFWIGGQDFERGITVYQAYEAVGDNSYQPVARIELRYSLSITTNYVQAVDIDDDGKEEIIISSGNRIFILKFAGSPGEHIYKLWYAKLGEATQPGASIYPVAIADLDGDGEKDLLIPFRKYQAPVEYAFSYILRQGEPLTVQPDSGEIGQDVFIHNYPNPFNTASTISFNVTESSNVQLKVYNSLGKEINLLLDKELSPGEYSIQWDAKDKYGNLLPSGIYFISLRTDNVFKTTKTILLK